jgi:hypothetical protein
MKYQQCMRINMGKKDNPHMIKVNAQMVQENMISLKNLLMLMKYKDILAYIYKDLIPP